MKKFFRETLCEAGHRFIPFLDWIGELKKPAVLKADILAGITVALVLIPQAMAYAQLAGLPPHYGLYASFLVPIVAAIFGSSRQLQNGPVAIISLMTAAALAPLGLNVEQTVMYAALLALMAGGIQLTLGFLRLGVMVDFLSHPVVIGFTNAAALVIASMQVGKLFGIVVTPGNHLHETLWKLAIAIPKNTHMATLFMGSGALVLLILLKRFFPKLPGILITVVITTVVAWFTGYEKSGGAVVGHIPAGLPSFVWPEYNSEHVKDLMLPAGMIAFLSFVEAFSIAKAVASKTRQRLSADQEMVGKGLANLVAGVFQGYSVSGSFSRTAVAFDAGAKTGFAAVVSGIVVGITLLFLTPLMYHLPIATLAAIIIIAVVGLFQIAPLVHSWKVNPHDTVVALVVFNSTIYFAPHLEKGIYIGIALSLAFYIYRTMRPHFAEVAMHEDGTYRDANLFGMQTSESLALFRYDGDLYFVNAGYLEKRLVNAVADKPQLLVAMLDIEAVEQIDTTGEEMLAHMSEWFKEAGIEFYITRPKFKVVDVLKRTGLYEKIGQEHIYSRRQDALEAIQQKYGDRIDIKHLQHYIPVEKTV
ncbi:SulP family inorganic anion transporter [Desulforhopalus sp. IMCC35007]|uniref:SulP family inorganic anion transporter n=1 Tax=Desulforhopalus sp. IMCC35007 TaxID=2569543 RepID=UPI0010AEA65C|nr:sulfate permease [Desulforhopalus sp. IMCC35007]TKB10400.1 sulfate permease [Desulforhopalus sp. IMCC35007]